MKIFIKNFIVNFIGLAVVLWILHLIDPTIGITAASLPFFLMADIILASIEGVIASMTK